MGALPEDEPRDSVFRHASLLGFELCLEEGRLFYFDPVGNVRLLTYTEQDTARQQAEIAEQTMQAERDRHLAARRSAEARIVELERQLGAQKRRR